MASAKNKVTDVDKGAKKLLKRLAKAAEVTVGIHEPKGAEPKEGDDDGDTALIDVAIIHEFGAPKAGIPARSFIRAWADESRQRHNDEVRKMAKAVIEGKLDAVQALERLGLRRKAEVQKRISAGIDPPLKQSTIDRKGSSKPLIDTGQLRSGIDYEVKETK